MTLTETACNSTPRSAGISLREPSCPARSTRSLRDFTTHYPDGTEFPRDTTAWRDIDWDSGIVMIEPSWAGSPPENLPVVPLFSRDELLECFGMDIRQDRMTERKRGGKPLQYDWDAFWVEVCRRTHQDGLPETQAELVDGMLDWFFHRGKEEIDRRTIEKKISKLFAVLRPD